MSAWVVITANIVSLAQFFPFKWFLRTRDVLWTLIFSGCAITVVGPYYVFAARVAYRWEGQLRWRVERPRSISEYQTQMGVPYGTTPFKLRGVLWAPGHDGPEVDALRVATALADDRAA